MWLEKRMEVTGADPRGTWLANGSTLHRTAKRQAGAHIADLEGEAEIQTHHLAEGIKYWLRRQL